MKPIAFAEEMRRLTDGFTVQPLTEQRGLALYGEYGGQDDGVVKRAVDLLLLGDRYPSAPMLAAAFERARDWDHERRREAILRHARRGESSVAGALSRLATNPGPDVDPIVPGFCLQAFEFLSRGFSPLKMAEFYRAMAPKLPASLRIEDEACVLEGWGDEWPEGGVLFPLASGRGDPHGFPPEQRPATQEQMPL